MTNLNAFLHPELPEEKEIIVSERFKDEAGNPIPFKIRPITQEQNAELMKRATRTVKDRTGINRQFDANLYSRLMVVAGTVYPDFSDAQLCDGYNVADPALVPEKMLLAGEYMKLSEAISNLSGIGEDVEAEAKN